MKKPSSFSIESTTNNNCELTRHRLRDCGVPRRRVILENRTRAGSHAIACRHVVTATTFSRLRKHSHWLHELRPIAASKLDNKQSFANKCWLRLAKPQISPILTANCAWQLPNLWVFCFWTHHGQDKIHRRWVPVEFGCEKAKRFLPPDFHCHATKRLFHPFSPITPLIC